MCPILARDVWSELWRRGAEEGDKILIGARIPGRLCPHTHLDRYERYEPPNSTDDQHMYPGKFMCMAHSIMLLLVWLWHAWSSRDAAAAVLHSPMSDNRLHRS